MIALVADENFNADIVRGLLRRQPRLDVVTVVEAGLRGAGDLVVLHWAAENSRILLTHDENTIPRFAYDRVAAGQPMPGVFEVAADAPIGPVIEDVLLLAECSIKGEWEGQVLYFPL